jgi:putative membrane protein
MMWYFGRGVPGPWGWVPMLFGLLVWIAVVAAVAYLVVALVRRQPVGGGGPPPEDPLRVLAARYARGEIDRDAYLRMREDLEGRRP